MHLKIKIEFDQNIKALESQFIDLIKKRFGVVMHSHQNYELFKTIQNACNLFQLTPSEYLNQLIDCPIQSPLLEHLVSGITVGETYFFRDKQQMELLQNNLLPSIIKDKREKNSLSIRIWSAGCATGEEIYSIVMMLYEILPDIEKWTIKLLATDINTNSIQKAIAGSYTEWSMRSISDYFKQKYFHKENNRYILVDKVKILVNFDYLNLNDDNYPSIFNGTNAQDLIICRNVLIYIDNKSCNNLMKRINQSLVQGGYLMLGVSDPVNVSETDFIFHDRRRSLFLRPTDQQTNALVLPEIVLPEIKVNKTHLYKKPIKKYSRKTEEKTSHSVVEKDLTSRAIDLANVGKLEEAIKLCEKGFKLDPTNKLNYFTYGLAMSELNKLPEAESALRKTLFLDNQFVAGHFQLGLLLLRKNQCESGLKSLKNALVIAESKRLEEEEVPGSPGLCYKDLADILRKEINIYMKSDT